MRVTFVGVGEAFDETLPNTSLFVEGRGPAGRATVLLDCGFTAAAAFFACPSIVVSDREVGPDAVWISHFHGDHSFGLPYLLARLHEAGRTRSLAVRGGPGTEGAVAAVVDMAYPNLREKLGFAVEAASAAPGEAFALAGFPARAALTGHGAPCLALRLGCGDKALYYGGDGAPTAACRELATGCDVLIQEAYGLTAGVPGHGSVEEAVALAREAGAATLAVVHVRRELRRQRSGEIERMLRDCGLAASLPVPGAVTAP